jgi:hypothetical protein
MMYAQLHNLFWPQIRNDTPGAIISESGRFVARFDPSVDWSSNVILAVSCGGEGSCERSAGRAVVDELSLKP